VTRSQHTRAGEPSDSAASSRKRAVKRIVVFSVLAVVVVAAAAGFVIYRNLVKPFQTTLLVVDGTPIGMRYFLKRLALYDVESLHLLDTLAKEEVLKKTVTKPPYNIAVSEQDIDQLARDLARGGAQTIDEQEFSEWYRQQLNEIGFTDAEFRELLKTELLSRRMAEYLAERVPSTAEQVYVNMITVQDFADAAEIKRRFDAGEDFAALARIYSRDSAAKDRAGRVGWIPRGVLDAGLESVVFGLGIGEASDPVRIDEQNVIVLVVSERAASREIDEEPRKVFESKALDSWLQQEMKNHQVELRGFTNGYDSETDAWVTWQLSRMRRRTSAGQSTR
jgi:foldase protein PrsA